MSEPLGAAVRAAIQRIEELESLKERAKEKLLENATIMDKYKNTIVNLHDELQRAKASIETTKDLLVEAENKITDFKTSNERLSKNLREEKNKFLAREQAWKSSAEETVTIQNKIQSKEKLIKELRRQKDDLSTEKESLQSKFDFELEELRRQNRELQQNASVLREQIEKFRKKIENHQTDMEGANRAVQEAKSARNESNRRYRESENEKEKLEIKIEELNVEIQKLTQQLEEIKKQSQKHKDDLDACLENGQKLEKTSEKLKQKMNRMKKAQDEQNKAQEAMTRERVEKLRARRQKLREKEAGLKSTLELMRGRFPKQTPNRNADELTSFQKKFDLESKRTLNILVQEEKELKDLLKRKPAPLDEDPADEDPVDEDPADEDFEFLGLRELEQSVQENKERFKKLLEDGRKLEIINELKNANPKLKTKLDSLSKKRAAKLEERLRGKFEKLLGEATIKSGNTGNPQSASLYGNVPGFQIRLRF